MIFSGERGIRTPETLASLIAFEAIPFSQAPASHHVGTVATLLLYGKGIPL